MLRISKEVQCRQSVKNRLEGLVSLACCNGLDAIYATRFCYIDKTKQDTGSSEIETLRAVKPFKLRAGGGVGVRVGAGADVGVGRCF